MTRSVLLLELGAGPLPTVTPVAAQPASWAPAVYVPPPVPVPGGFVAAGLIDGMALSWNAVAGATEYAVERAPNVNNAPGAWVQVQRVTGLGYSVSIAGGTKHWWRVRAFINGRPSAYTAAALATAAAAATSAEVLAAQQAADNAVAAANAASTAIANIASDNLLTPSEKSLPIREHTQLNQEWKSLVDQANAYGVVGDYSAKLTELNDYLGTLTTPVPWDNLGGDTEIQGATFRQKFAAVYTARTVLLAAIHAKAKTLADIAQNTANSVVVVQDGDFESGGLGWVLPAGFYTEASSNAAYRGTRGLVHGPGSGAYADASCAAFPVVPGETLLAECMMRNLGGGANGNVHLRVWLYTAAGAYIDQLSNTPFTKGELVSGTEWRKVTTGARITHPNAALARVGVALDGRTVGYYAFDQFRATRLTNTFAGGQNLLPNSNFGGANGYLAPWVPGWNSDGVQVRYNSRVGSNAGPAWWPGGMLGVLEVRQLDAIMGVYGVVDVACDAHIPVVAGQRYQFHFKACNHRCGSMGLVQWRDINGNTIAESGTASVEPHPAPGGTEAHYTQVGLFAEAPPGAVRAFVVLRKGNTRPGNADSWAFFIKPFFGIAAPHQTEFTPWSESAPYSADGLSNGTHFGTVATGDLWDSGFSRRLGLRVAGSGHRIGDNRNLPQIMVGNGRAKVATTISYQASAGIGGNATATISVGAFNIVSGSVTVSYASSGVGVGAPGGSQVTYFLYMDDAAYQGGARTLVATTDGNAVYSADGRVFIGSCTVVFPTSGSTGGGGGRLECVAFGMYVDADTRAEDARPGHRFDCIDWPSGTLHPFTRALQAVEHSIAPCVRLVTEHGAALVCSVSTPFDLPDGRCVLAPDMLGELVLTDLGVERVHAVQDAGNRQVCHIHLGGISYAAGEDPAHRIYSHNQFQKP